LSCPSYLVLNAVLLFCSSEYSLLCYTDSFHSWNPTEKISTPPPSYPTWEFSHIITGFGLWLMLNRVDYEFIDGK
jgi:hypothetical protein